MKFSKRDQRIQERQRRIRKRERIVETLILLRLEAGDRQAFDILQYIRETYGEVPEHWCMRLIYRLMGVDESLLPLNPEDDMILL